MIKTERKKVNKRRYKQKANKIKEDICKKQKRIKQKIKI